MTAFFAFRSVRQKLFSGAVLTSLVALVVTGASLFVYDLHTYRQNAATDLALQADLLGNVSTAALQFDDQSAAAKNLAFLHSRDNIRAAVLFTPRGAVFATYLRPDVEKEALPRLPGPDATTIRGDVISGYHRIVSNGEIAGTIYLEANLGMYERSASYAAIAFAVMLAALLASLMLSSWLQESITAPIIQISGLAREVVDKRVYSMRATRTTNDEIGTLVDAFNEMLSEIETRTAAREASAQEVGRLNRDLERRVSDRTAQLEETNLKLEAANAAKSTFLSMMSHEIRTPMNGVMGMLEMLSLTELEPQQRTTLEVVRESGRSLLRIIDDILDFSKIEAGKLEVRPEVASVARMVESVAGIYSGNASSKGLVLKSHVDPRISPAVLVDPLRLQQILNNFVSNAIKFTRKGLVEIRAELLEHRDGRDLVRFSVTDSGIGISPAEQALLFQPFAQAGSDTARVFGGTGLGLSICQRLAKLMGSSIAIESAVGKGTTMSLALELIVADPAALPKPDDAVRSVALAENLLARRVAPGVEQAAAEGTLVLLVDDHPINRLVLVRQVTALGYASESCENGREALALWKSGRFALIITDCNMPEMDGYELARTVRSTEAANGGKRVIIIACTANALRGEAENCFAAGMDDYVAKPVELAQMRHKLDQWLPIGPVAGTPGSAASGAGAGHLAGAAGGADAVAERAHAAHAPVDLGVLAEVSGGDALVERGIIREFLRANAADAQLLAEALQAQDAALLVQAAHRIRGASAAVGASAFSEACAHLERGARAGDWEAVMGNLDGFHRELARLNTYLGALFA